MTAHQPRKAIFLFGDSLTEYSWTDDGICAFLASAYLFSPLSLNFLLLTMTTPKMTTVVHST